MRHESRAAGRRIRRQGVTLLELIVVIALLGLVLAIAAPTFIVRKSKADFGLAAILVTARRAAILRGEPVTLTVDPENAWRLEGDANPTAPPIATGQLGASVGTLRVHVSPLGTCVADAGVSATAADWNALDCRFARAAEGVAR